MKGSEVLVKSLKCNGINKVYGILGREAAAIQFNELGNEVEFCLTHHENTAGMMACSIAQCTKKAQACFVTLGPGLTHIMTSVAMAALDRLPVLFLAAQVERDGMYYNNAHQCIDGVSATRPFVKYSHQIEKLADIPVVVAEAFEKMLTPPFGPAFISIPIDVLLENEEVEIFENKAVKNICRNFVNSQDVNEMIDSLQKAKNPIIIIGDATYKYKSSNRNVVLEFAEQLNIPILSTYASAGFIPIDHKLNWGILNSYEKHFLKHNVWKEYFEDVDLILLIGYDPVEHHPRTWCYGKEKKVISLMPYKLELKYNNVSKLYSIVCDIDTFLDEVKHNVKDLRFAPNENVIIDIRQKRSFFTNHQEEDKIFIWNIHHILNKYFKDNMVVVSDVGLNRHISSVSVKANVPYSFLTSAGLSSFGTGLAMGMGAKIALEDKDVVVVAGDGGFLSSCYDLETAVREQLKMLVVVYNSSAYSLIERYLKAGKSNKDNPTVTQFGRVDFSMLAKSMGCNTKRVTNICEFEEAVNEYIANDSVYVIDVAADYKNLYL